MQGIERENRGNKMTRLCSIDMSNGITYIGKSEDGVTDDYLLLKEAVTVPTKLVAQIDDLRKCSYLEKAKTWYEWIKDKEKEIIIEKKSGLAIHFLGE